MIPRIVVYCIAALMLSCARTDSADSAPRVVLSAVETTREPVMCVLRPTTPFCDALRPAQWIVRARVKEVKEAVELPVSPEEETIEGVPQVTELCNPVVLYVTEILRESGETVFRPEVDSELTVYFIGSIDPNSWVSGDGPLRKSAEMEGVFALREFEDGSGQFGRAAAGGGTGGADERWHFAVQTGLYLWTEDGQFFNSDWHFRDKETISLNNLYELVGGCYQ